MLAAPRVLVVDDEVLWGRACVKMLRRLGYEAEAIADPAVALHELATGRWHCAVVDFIMPTMTGEELVAELHRVRPRLPVVICTAYVDPAIRSFPPEVPVVLLAKSPSIDELANAIGHAVGEQMARQRVLVVDDDRSYLEMLVGVLEADGYAVDAVGSPPDALELATRYAMWGIPHDLAIVDLLMPEMTGFELMAELRKRAIAIPFVLNTAYVDHPMAHDAMRLGAVGFLKKPATLDDVGAEIHRAMAEHSVHPDLVRKFFSTEARVRALRAARGS